MNAEDIAAELVDNAAALRFEVDTLADEFNRTGFFGDIRNFPTAHYGYLMACMGQIDVMSVCDKGRIKRGEQTPRMRGFMARYLDAGKVEEHRVAVQLMRHTLMHTGALRYVYDEAAGCAYTWRVGFTAPWSAGHYTLTVEDVAYQADLVAALAAVSPAHVTMVKALNIELPAFAADVFRAAEAFAVMLRTNPAIGALCERVYSQIRAQPI